MNELRNLTTAIKVIMQVAPEIPIQQLEVFLYIAEQDTPTANTEVAKALGMDEQVCSRRVAALTERSYTRGPGLGLIKQTVNPMELRRKDLELTEAGTRLVATLKGVLA